MNSEVMSSCSQFKHCSKLLAQPRGIHIRSLFVLNHMKHWHKLKLGKVAVGLNTALSHLWASRSYIWSLFDPLHNKGLPQVKLVYAGFSSNITPNHFLGLQEVIFGYFVYELMWKVNQKLNQVSWDILKGNMTSNTLYVFRINSD